MSIPPTEDTQGVQAATVAGAPSQSDAAALPPEHGGGFFHRLVRVVVRGALVIVVLAAGALAAWTLIKTGPKAKRKKPARQAQLVEVRVVSPSRQRITVQVMGTVGAAQTTALRPRVSGEIVGLSPEFVPGGWFKAGAEIAKIDPDDYRLAVEQQEAEVARLAAVVVQRLAEVAQREGGIAQSQSAIEQRQSEILQRQNNVIAAEAALRTEQGQQDIAKQEYGLLGKTVRQEDRDLVLRQPQLRTAQAALDAAKAAKGAAEAGKRAAEASKRAAEAMKESAEAVAKAAQASHKAAIVALKKAQLDLARTAIRAPFNAAVDAKSADLGSQVSPTTELGRLVGIDEYWVEVSVPVDQLKWIRIPRTKGDKGSMARIHNEAAWGEGVSRKGTVFRLTSALETEGRMARLLVVVADPLALKPENAGKPAMLIGSYVRVEIDGSELDGVIALDRDLLHEGTKVWVMDGEAKLDIREVTIAYRGRERVLVAGGIKAGERLVTSDLPAPVQGMPLRTRDAKPPKAAAAGAAPQGGKGAEAKAQ